MLYNCDIGPIRIKASDGYVNELCFLEGDTLKAPEVPEQPDVSTDPVLVECVRQLDEYFEGRRQLFSLPLKQEGTPFQQKVWAALLKIPFGKTISYRELSQRIGDTNAIRAVGRANGKNQLAILVPCHRVIGSDQSLTGYAGGMARKRWLLDHENKYAHGDRLLF
ncbi:MAG: methylated-DNA--[protein]-cysteine S-methyltransferase [Bacteroidota bacterium]|nr:methylated-DNA--[protein]-cysteine S-methyltransferase [Bacteroidota bacterium]